MERWPFLDQNHGLTPLEKCQFFYFLNFLGFYGLERRFFVLEYHKTHFPDIYCIKKIVAKKAIFGPKPWVNPFWKNVNFSTFWSSYIYGLERRFFVVEYHKRHFPGLYCLKKKVGKMAIFGRKTWVNLFEKMSIFRLFKLLAFIA